MHIKEGCQSTVTIQCALVTVVDHQQGYLAEKEQLLLAELSEIKRLYETKEKQISSLKEELQAVQEKMTALKEDDSKQKELKMLQQIGKLNEFT